MRAGRPKMIALAVALVLSACNTSTSPSTVTTGTTSTRQSSAETPPTTNPVIEDLADAILHSGQVITVDGDFSIAEAVAIRDGEIVAVGSSSDLLELAGADTTVVDLGGKTVLPGFVDPHTHAVQHLAFDSNLEAMKAAERDLLAGGTTTTGAPTVSPDDLEGFLAFEASGDLVLRTHLYLAYNDPCGDRPYGDHYQAHQFGRDPDRRLAIAGVKIFTDGGVCEAPAISSSYPDTVPDRLKEIGFVGHGALYVTPDEVADVVSEIDDLGGLVVLHAIGDVAIRTALEGLAQANRANPLANPHRIDHNSLNSLLNTEELEIYGQLGMVPVVFPVRWANGCDPAASDAWRAILPQPELDALENTGAMRASNPGLRVSWHGDAPSIPGKPLQLMFSYVTGGAVDIDTGTVCYPEVWQNRETVGIEEAIRMT
ncbi:MAG: amidohydrolase family protein, partial [Acidimicrobiia bacterium]